MSKQIEEAGEVELTPPEVFSLIESPESTIRFYKDVRNVFILGKNVLVNLEACTNICDSALAVLVACIKDRNINKGKAVNIKPPLNEECRKNLSLKQIFKKFDSDAKNLVLQDKPVQKVSNIIVANVVAKEIVRASSLFIYKREVRLKELYAILIELMANTNNHAATGENLIPWWMSVYRDDVSNTIKFIYLDFGVGVFNSLPVQQFIIRNPISVVDSQGFRMSAQRGQQISKIFSALAAGQIKSSTGDLTRGKGMPLITKHAKSGNFNSFYLIANDAYIDIINNQTSPMNEHFSGSLFYFELAESRQYA